MRRHFELPCYSGVFTKIEVTTVDIESCACVGGVPSIFDFPSFVIVIIFLGPSSSQHDPLTAGVLVTIGTNVAIIWASVNQKLEVFETKGFIVCVFIQG